jgi:hypothetical protein
MKLDSGVHGRTARLESESGVNALGFNSFAIRYEL